MSLQLAGGTVYMVISNDDLTAETKLPSYSIEFGPKRRTLKWRGRKFNVPTHRIVRIGTVSGIIEVSAK